MSLTVIAPGMRTLVEDLGRPGVAGLGVSPSGAADRGAHRLANRLLGNDEGAATLEVLAGGLVLEAVTATVIAVTGAPVPLLVGGSPAPMASPVYVPAGARIELGRPLWGLRTYVAALGGIDAPAVLGSRSSDTIARLGPPALAAGDVLEVGAGVVTTEDTHMLAMALGPASDVASASYGGPVGEAGSATARVRLTATWGPRADWFTPEARRAFAGSEWTVGADSDRVGVRCTGPKLERAVDGELASEAAVRGSVQVPPSGQPVLFLADHPTTGGYPVIAVLDPASVDRVAQLRPGDTVRVEMRSPAYDVDLAL